MILNVSSTFFRRTLSGTFLPLSLTVMILTACSHPEVETAKPELTGRGYFESPGFNVLVFSNPYNASFDDSKMSGVEIVHHEVRTVTNGDVRLSPTPGQWDPIPVIINRNVDRENQRIEVSLEYPDYGFCYRILTEAAEGGVTLSVELDRELPQALEGKAGLNLEFLPSAYFGKSFLMDSSGGVFPRYPGGPMESGGLGSAEPLPLATGRCIDLAPEDMERQIRVRAESGNLMLYDGRNQAQNGWFVVRSLIPPGKTGRVVSWHITAGHIEGWEREPVIGHSQVGYHPCQEKKAVIELSRNSRPEKKARLLKVTGNGTTLSYEGKVVRWGDYLRYTYYMFDFSTVREEGIYLIEYGGTRTGAFRIARDVYAGTWEPTLDVFFPVQMDHMLVREAYRVWHGVSHLDDALQAPVNHKHFDLYAQGPTTDTRFKPGEHIPGINIGGWYDAGDFDIRTQTVYSTVLSLVHAWEAFRPERDETTVDQATRYVEIHRPDGTPDIIQQIEHGTLALIAQHRACGRAISGIIEPSLPQYRHLGDASTKTDNKVYNPRLDSLESDGFTSGTFDDRWAFTSRSTPLNYGSAAALAAASRALRGYNNKLADECLSTAVGVWKEEHSHQPFLFRHGNTTGGHPEDEELTCAVELLLATGDPVYRAGIEKLWPAVEKRFAFNAPRMIPVLSQLDKTYTEKMEELARTFSMTSDSITGLNPYGVPISEGGWAGNGWVVFHGITCYQLHKLFPDIINREKTLRAMNYLYGCHPGSDISFVSGVGSHSKTVAYGNNRADFSFIAGGVVPGVLILPPDFPENKEDWPFLWGENEYVIGLGASYLYLALAVNDMLSEQDCK